LRTEERRGRILALLERQGSVRVETLAKAFGVSEVTIRKDLTALEAQGLLQRVYGGAVYLPRSLFNPSFEEKRHQNVEAKEAIALAALAQIVENDAIILDAGTTTLALAKALKGRFRRLFVITNSIPIALELSGEPFEILLTGGTVRHHSGALIGPTAVAALEAFQADKAFLGATGVSLEKGYTTPNPTEAQTKQAMLRSAKSRFVLADGSKLDRATLARFAKLNEVDLLITDASAPESFLSSLAERGLQAMVADLPLKTPRHSGRREREEKV